MIELINVTKSFAHKTALEAVSLLIESDAIVGFVGTDGAGKTALLQLIASLIKPTSGEIFVADASTVTDAEIVRRLVGYMPAQFGAYSDLTVGEYLRFFAACYDVHANEINTAIDNLLQLVDLHHRRDDRIEPLTQSAKQRLALARTLVHDPQVLLLDEPFAKLDPRAQVEMSALISELSDMGKTIVLTAASLPPIQSLCTHIGLMHEGRLVAFDWTDAIKQRAPSDRRVQIKFMGDVPTALRVLNESPNIHDAHEVAPLDAPTSQPNAIGLREIVADYNGDYQQAAHLLKQLMRSGTQVVVFHEIANTDWTITPDTQVALVEESVDATT